MAFLLIFKSETQVYEAESALSEKSIPCQIIAAPDLPEDIGDACGDVVLMVDNPDLVQMFENARLVEVSDDMI
jgi:hypothetical protein